MEIPNTQNINLNLNENHEAGRLSRMGFQIEPEEHDITQEDYILYNSVLGKVKDLRDFTEHQIENWVAINWSTHDEIQVRKVGKIFFFYAQMIEIEQVLLIWDLQTIKEPFSFFLNASPMPLSDLIPSKEFQFG